MIQQHLSIKDTDFHIWLEYVMDVGGQGAIKGVWAKDIGVLITTEEKNNEHIT